MIKHENDKLIIPNKYLKMSVTELESKSNKILESLKKKPRSKRRKKVDNTKVMFHI